MSNWLKPLQYIVYFSSYLVWGILFWWVGQWGRVESIWWWVGMLGIVLFIYARFVEPHLIVIKREKRVLHRGQGGRVLRIAFISDLHLGVFKGEKFLRRVLEMVRREKVDLLLVGGDLINDPTRRQLKKIFKPFAEMEVPVLAVTGNHDAKIPGDFSSEEVREKLRLAGVEVVDNLGFSFKLAEGQWVEIVGLSDLMEGCVDWTILSKLKAENINIVLAHNPDSSHQISAALPVDLVLSGHTHAGQIFLPPFSYWLIPTKYKFVKGWYEVNGHSVLVSSGLGEVVLPLRFMIPPEIVVLEVVH